jgi:uncharacterized protein YegL
MITPGPDDASTMPGGGISRRPLHVIIMADCSGSMRGENMQALNFAIADMLSHLAEWELDQERADVLIRVLAFATVPSWHLSDPTPVGQVRWRPLQSVDKGRTNLGPALQLVADALGSSSLERRALRPAILLVTDGRPTDRPGQLEAGLASLHARTAGRSALRLAVAIGRNASSIELKRFIGDPTVPVLVADNTDEIASRLVAASIAVTRMSEAGADRSALVDQLLRREPGADAPGPDAVGPDHETAV